MDAHDVAATEQKVELLKEDLKFAIEYSYFSMPLDQTNRYRKTEVGNPLEILKNHQSHEIKPTKKF